MELCIDFGGTEIKLAVIDGGRILASENHSVRGDASDLESAAAAVRRLSSHAATLPNAHLPAAVGIAVPGVVDPSSGRMLHANDKYDFLRDLDLREWAQAEFGLPAIIENDARAALIGETSTGSASGERDAVLITLGTGIGTAAMIDGVALRGVTGHAGILGGHVTVDVHAVRCPCGNVGCGEVLASAWVLKDETLTVKDLFESDEYAELRNSFLHVWGTAVVTLCHMYDPAVVILSGGILRAGDAVSEPIENHVREHLWPSMTPPRFVVPPDPEYSVARGLSTLARHAHPPTQEDQETH